MLGFSDVESSGPNMTDANTRTCVACGSQAPTTETEYTLIGAKHAWRCKKAVTSDGNAVLEWFCPSCWKKVQAKLSAPQR
jgi:hypothetical protein